MERLTQGTAVAIRALATLEELVHLANPTAVERDAAIQRFEYTSPRATIRACRDIGLLSDEQAVAALQMADDRNLTSHTYNEVLATNLWNRLAAHGDLLSAWLVGLRARAANPTAL
ncbi:MAG: nucleotidyltransferase substrate binding protein [Polyangia bacterium]|jgi:hypothetical protein